MKRSAETPDVMGPLRDMRGDYAAARSSPSVRRPTGIVPSGSGADYHYRLGSDYYYILEAARVLDRDDMLVGQAINRVVDNVIQTGIIRDAKTGDDEADSILQDTWDEWASTPLMCHNEARLNWHQLERMAFRAAYIVDGDHVLFPTEAGAVWPVESHRLRTPQRTVKNVVHGLELNDDGQIIRYWVTKQDVGATNSVRLVKDVNQYPAWDSEGNPLAWFISDPTRISQRRGVSRLVPVLKPSSMLDDALFAQLLKFQIANCVAIVRSLAASGQPPAGLSGTIGETEVRQVATARRLLQHMFPGMEVVSERPGEEVQMFSPNIATSDTYQFTLLMICILAVNLNLPVAVLLLDGQLAGNFSSLRGVLEESRRTFRRMVTDYIQQLHVPAWRWHVRKQLAREDKIGVKLRAIGDRIGTKVFGHRWNAKTHGYIEPLKDATANRLRQESLQTSPRRLHAELGQDWFELVGEIVEDNAFAIRTAVAECQKLREEFPDQLGGLQWRELLSLTGTQNLSIAINANEPSQGTAPQSDKGQRAAMMGAIHV